jgi:non-haem Fe2+, alpha-ketoglutarate-dependent halogenase
MPSVLSAAEAARYHETGYHFPVRAFSTAEADALYRRVLESERMLGGPFKGRVNQKCHLLFPWLYDLVTDDRVLDAVEPILGPDIFCWSAGFFHKRPHDGNYVSWHQDATYWGLSSPDVMTVWVAISPANKVSGCMKFIAGTHKTQVTHEDTFNKDNLLTRGQEIAVEVNEADAVYAELAPGQASLHHVLLFHGSAPNQSDDRRIGLAIRYIPTHVKQAVGSRDWATLVRGVDTFGNFAPEPRPVRDLDPAALAFHKEVSEEQVRVLYRGTGKDAYRP